VLWEIIEREEPHQDEPIVDIAIKIRDFGFHPNIPSYAPGYIQNLMKRCWKMQPEERPTFVEILETLDALNSEDKIAVTIKKSTRQLSGKKSTRWLAVQKPESKTHEEINASIRLNKKASKRGIVKSIESRDD